MSAGYESNEHTEIERGTLDQERIFGVIRQQ
jgi:hypothetical protein